LIDDPTTISKRTPALYPVTPKTRIQSFYCQKEVLIYPESD